MRTGLLRAARTRGAGQLVRRRTYAARVPASGVPYVPCTERGTAVAPQAAVDLEARLKSLQAGFRTRHHSWYISTGLAQSLSAGSLLFARAALCCERCGNREGCRNFDSVDPVSHRMVGRLPQGCGK